MAYKTQEDPNYWNWLETANRNPISDDRVADFELKLKEEIKEQLDYLRSVDVNEYALFHKYHELQDWVPKQDIDVVHEVRDLIWKPKGRGDYRYIDPELVFVKNSVLLESVDYFGNTSTKTVQFKEPYLQHWQIMRTLISSARNDSTVGRQLRFIVRDKPTKTYLGVICISSDMLDLKPRNNALKVTSKFLGSSGLLQNMANGQSIIPVQYFGKTFLGGKLIALLCLSDVIEKCWEEFYGQKLVAVSTTSLWGKMKPTSIYNGLTPYWVDLKETTDGTSPLKPTDALYEKIKNWMQNQHPEEYFNHFHRKGESGMLFMRDNKSRALAWTYGYFGFKKSQFESNHTRRTYFSRLFKNTDSFLRGEIKEDELIRAFDNSIPALTEFWKFGYAGSTTTSPSELTKKYGKDLKRGAKGRIDKMVREKDDFWIDESIEWWEEIHNKDWETVREKYLHRIGR